MKKGIVAVVIALVSFVAGLTGTYYAMPALNPELVEALQRADSLATAQTQAAPDSQPKPLIEPWALERLEKIGSDSVRVLQQAALQMMGLSHDSLESLVTLARKGEQMEDALHNAGSETDAVGEQRQDGPGATSEALAKEAEALGRTIAKLEDNEMKALVERLDPGVFRLIYEAASERNRTRLLQALPPDQAARFVREFLVGPQKQATVSANTTRSSVAVSEPQEASTDEL